MIRPPLHDLLASKIKSDGPLGLDEFMAECLSHEEHGYYASRASIGKDGDFITAPEVSQMFGELCGLWGLDQLLVQGVVAKAGWVELGGGRGTMIADILRVCSSSQIEGVPSKWAVHIVEINASFMREQREKLAESCTLHHHKRLGDLPPRPFVFLANEFFDALPIRQFVAHGGRWFERLVGIDNDDSFCVVRSETPETDLRLTAPESDDMVLEYATGLRDIVKAMAEHINSYGGAVLIIDYGKEDGFGDSLQAVSEHHPVDILESVGQSDLSAWVDFSAIRRAATDSGAKVFGAQSQGIFLKQIGLYERAEQLGVGADSETRRKIMSAVDRLSSPAQMGGIFKVMALLPSSHPAMSGDEVAGFASVGEMP